MQGSRSERADPCLCWVSNRVQPGRFWEMRAVKYRRSPDPARSVRSWKDSRYCFWQVRERADTQGDAGNTEMSSWAGTCTGSVRHARYRTCCDSYDVQLLADQALITTRRPAGKAGCRNRLSPTRARPHPLHHHRTQDQSQGRLRTSTPSRDRSFASPRQVSNLSSAPLD